MNQSAPRVGPCAMRAEASTQRTHHESECEKRKMGRCERGIRPNTFFASLGLTFLLHGFTGGRVEEDRMCSRTVVEVEHVHQRAG